MEIIKLQIHHYQYVCWEMFTLFYHMQKEVSDHKTPTTEV